jgi:DNA-binding NtrC family response regulator
MSLKHAIWRVRGRETMEILTRLIFATTADPGRMLEKELFHKDLYNLNAFGALSLSRLRQRREDIPPSYRPFCAPSDAEDPQLVAPDDFRESESAIEELLQAGEHPENEKHGGAYSAATRQ